MADVLGGDAQRAVLAALRDRHNTRDDIAILYARALSEVPHSAVGQWRAVNVAIMERWSPSALNYIKNRAWRQHGMAGRVMAESGREAPTPERKSRDGWALDEANMPQQVTGWECPDDYWWCPKIGYSVPGRSLFTTEAEARREAISVLTAQRDHIEKKLAGLADAV